MVLRPVTRKDPTRGQHDQQHERAEQPELLGVHGKDEVGLALGQKAQMALGALQAAIDNFGPSNGDAIVTASVYLSATADSW